jgi:hypothetical protein
MPEVANPAVIIGLGGTGKWVLTYIKKNLLDTYGGQIPKTVRLLSFDTTSERVSRDGVAQEEDVRIGDVQLDKQAEFVYLGGNIYQLCREVRDERKHPHIGSWLQARTYLQMADSDAFDISRGAGQKRPFGRMAIFYDLQQSVQARITNKIQSAISEVIGANQRRAAIEIYVVASLAGGTGSGMFIDMAHLARWFADKQIRTGFAVRGFLALHNTFRSVIKTEQIQPQAFAALRELDRFIQVFDQQYPIVYNPTNPILNTIYGGQLGKLFDNCYLLDASRENLPLDNFAPNYGVFPSIADCITMLLDGSTGDAYAQHYKNVNTRIGEVQSQINQPIYSSLGTYSLVLPVEDIITSLTYRFAIDLLGEYLLNLEQRTNDAGQVQYILRYEGNAREEAAALLHATQSVSGVANTNFIQRVPATIDSRNTRHEAYISEIASLEAPELLTWIIPPETDPTVQELARKVRDDLEVQLITRVPTSENMDEDTVGGCDRVIRGTRDFREEYLGRDVGGRRTGGLYRRALEQCVSIHRERYQILLQEYILSLLNGPAPTNKDYQHEKRGKLGQAQAVLSHLALYFTDLSTFLERVEDHRENLDDLRSAQEEASLCRSEMEKQAGVKGFIGTFITGQQPAIKAQNAYLEAEQWAIDIEIKDLFFDFLHHTSNTLRTVTEEYKAAVDAWINTLVQGFSGTFTDPGLYTYLHTGLQRHTANRTDKQRIAVHEYVTDDAYESGLYASVSAGKFVEALTHLVWVGEQQDQGFRLSLSGCTIAGSGPTGGRSSTDRNADFFLHMARNYFEPLRESLTIADRLTERDAMRLASTLLDKCSPMIRYDPLKSGGAQELHYFVCVNEGRQKAYFNEFRDALRRLGASAKDNQVLDSSNSYTCTILATADVVASSGLHAYTAAEREYNSHTGDARLLHIFPAEVNAVQLEQQLTRIGEQRRRFSHVLTTMLEDRKMVEHFILATLYRLIRLEKAESMQSRWVLFLPTQRRRGTDRFALTNAEHQPSLFKAMECFVFRRADINNSAQTIDFPLLEEELRRFEDRASEGNDSRLINLLEGLINSDIEPRRHDRDQAIHDLGSLMRLLVDEIVEGLHSRIKASGQHYDPDALPLDTSALPADSKPTAPRETGNGTTDGAGGSPAVEPISVAAPVSEIDKPAVPTDGNTDTEMAALDKLKTMLDRGLISQEKYDAKVQEILDRM